MSMTDNEEGSYIDVPASVGSPEYIDVVLPKWFLEDLEVMNRVADMRKRSFLFFKRPLSPSERMEVYLALTKVKHNA